MIKTRISVIAVYC